MGMAETLVIFMNAFFPGRHGRYHAIRQRPQSMVDRNSTIALQRHEVARFGNELRR